VATFSNEDHPLTSEKEDVKRAAVLIIASDRGLAGGYNSVGDQGERALVASLRDEGKEVVPYLSGARRSNFYKFRHRDFVAEWTGSPSARASRRP
jgi:F-type H+-transporting ATPase subunit gamma